MEFNILPLGGNIISNCNLINHGHKLHVQHKYDQDLTKQKNVFKYDMPYPFIQSPNNSSVFVQNFMI